MTARQPQSAAPESRPFPAHLFEPTPAALAGWEEGAKAPRLTDAQCAQIETLVWPQGRDIDERSTA